MLGLYFQQSEKDSNPLLEEIFLTWEKQHRVHDFKDHIEKIEAKQLTIRLFCQLHAVAQGIDLSEDFSNVFPAGLPETPDDTSWEEGRRYSRKNTGSMSVKGGM